MTWDSRDKFNIASSSSKVSKPPSSSSRAFKFTTCTSIFSSKAISRLSCPIVMFESTSRSNISSSPPANLR